MRTVKLSLSKFRILTALTPEEEQVTCEFHRLTCFFLDDAYISLKDKIPAERMSKYAYIELHERMTQDIDSCFLSNLIKDIPFKIHRILTDNGAQFTDALLGAHLRPKSKVHIFDQTCENVGILHKLTKFQHPWTNGQVEIINRKIEDHTTKKYHYDTVESLKKDRMTFLLAYNFHRPLKALKFKSPYDMILEIYDQKPTLFLFNPVQKILGLNILQ